uniref:ABC transmembrane type-1 domain-containing protein n=1 Tax=Amphimedon queenslandica TaxID=400682 RepID=A0A1X7SM31_AMPQE
MNEGRISEVGTYSELLGHNGEFSVFLQNYGSTDESDEKKQNTEKIAEKLEYFPDKDIKESTLLSDEKVQVGIVKMSVVFAYLKSFTFTIFLILLIFSFLSTGGYVGQLLWLAHWSNAGGNDNLTLFANLGIYATFGIVQSVSLLFASLTLSFGTVKASRRLHDEMLSSILRSPMSFFDTTPLVFSTFGVITIISVASPWFLIVIVPITVFYLIVQRFYVATSRQLKRLEATSRSPIYSHFQESIDGISSIRAYNVAERFRLQSELHVDYNQIALYVSHSSIVRWLSVQLDFVGSVIVFSAAMFATLQRNYPHIFGFIDPGLAGMSISQAFLMTLLLAMV